MKIGAGEWYEEVASRPGWRGMCRLGMEELAETSKHRAEEQKQQRLGKYFVKCVGGSLSVRHKRVDERRK